MDGRLTHINEAGEARMVDVGAKEITSREAVAEGTVIMHPKTLQLIMDGAAKKGDVLSSARIAGILAAKRTGELIPLCHSLPLTSAEIAITPLPPDRLHIRSTVRCEAKTGVEMEALAAVSVAALTVYDMVKAVDRGMEITGVRLVRKSGGKSGVWTRGGEA